MEMPKKKKELKWMDLNRRKMNINWGHFEEKDSVDICAAKWNVKKKKISTIQTISFRLNAATVGIAAGAGTSKVRNVKHHK